MSKKGDNKSSSAPQVKKKGRGFLANPWTWVLLSFVLVFGTWNPWDFSLYEWTKRTVVDIAGVNANLDIAELIQDHAKELAWLFGCLMTAIVATALYGLHLLKKSRLHYLPKVVVAFVVAMAAAVIAAWVMGIIHATGEQLAMLVGSVTTLTIAGAGLMYISGKAIEGLEGGHFWAIIIAVIAGGVLFVLLPEFVQWPEVTGTNITIFLMLALAAWMGFGYNSRRMDRNVSGWLSMNRPDVEVTHVAEDAASDIHEASHHGGDEHHQN